MRLVEVATYKQSRRCSWEPSHISQPEGKCSKRSQSAESLEICANDDRDTLALLGTRSLGHHAVFTHKNIICTGCTMARPEVTVSSGHVTTEV